MASGDDYRAKATDLLARARQEADPGIRAEFQHLAQGYLLLAEQADRNAIAAANIEPLVAPSEPAPPPDEPKS
jgi:hypothetical protein